MKFGPGTLLRLKSTSNYFIWNNKKIYVNLISESYRDFCPKSGSFFALVKGALSWGWKWSWKGRDDLGAMFLLNHGLIGHLAAHLGLYRFKIGPKTTKLQLFVCESSIDPKSLWLSPMTQLWRVPRLQRGHLRHDLTLFGLKPTLGKPFGSLQIQNWSKNNRDTAFCVWKLNRLKRVWMG